MKGDKKHLLWMVPAWLYGPWFGLVFPFVTRGWDFAAVAALFFGTFAFAFLLAAYPLMTGKIAQEKAVIYFFAIPVGSGMLGVLLRGLMLEIYF